MQDIYLGLSIIMLAIVPIVFLIPDTAADRAHGRQRVTFQAEGE